MSIKRIRDEYSFATAWRSQDRAGQRDLSVLRESNRAEFDAALAEHDRATAEKAWQEGVRHVHDTKCVFGKKDLNEPCPQNPFRSVPKENT
jgi:hypothetical protein